MTSERDEKELTYNSAEEVLSVLRGVPLGVAKEATDNMGTLVRYETAPDGSIVSPKQIDFSMG